MVSRSSSYTSAQRTLRGKKAIMLGVTRSAGERKTKEIDRDFLWGLTCCQPQFAVVWFQLNASCCSKQISYITNLDCIPCSLYDIKLFDIRHTFHQFPFNRKSPAKRAASTSCPQKRSASAQTAVVTTCARIRPTREM